MRAGTLVVHEGAPGDDFFVICDGRAAVSVGGTDVTTLAAGDCFGEIAVLGRGRARRACGPTPT